MRRPAARIKPRLAQMKSFPAPRNGWISNLNLAQPKARNSDGTSVSGAALLDNMFPTATSAVLRRGSEVFAQLTETTKDVLSLFAYVSGAAEQIFAANDEKIYDVTTTATAVLSGQTGGNWVVVQFATTGGVFLRGVNGADTPFVYDGSTFATTPALTFAAPDAALTPDILNFLWPYKNRLFFLEKDSLDAWYLPVDQIGGELTKLPLGGVFTRGGSLLFGATWSLDSGEQGGLSEQCIFVTTEGEVAVYQGADPSDAAAWGKVGVYRIGRPLGPKAFVRAGGDLVIATTVGFVPLSQAVQRDYAALSPSAVSYPIEVAWNTAVTERASSPWHCEVWANQQMAVVVLPTGNQQEAVMFVANVRTGAWARFTGWNGTCIEVFRDRMFFGSINGKVVEANVSGQDQDLPYTGICVPLFDDLGAPASLKITDLVRPVIRSLPNAGLKMSIQRDFQISLPPPPDASIISASNVWGTAVWGVSIWGQTVDLQTRQEWVSASGEGSALAPALQVTSGSEAPVDVELIRIDMLYEVADVMT